MHCIQVPERRLTPEMAVDNGSHSSFDAPAQMLRDIGWQATNN